MKRATLLLKLVYCLNLLGLALPLGLAGLSGGAPSAGSTVSASLAAVIGAAVALVLMVTGLARIGLVAAVPGTLDSWPLPGAADGVRALGLAGVHAGAAVALWAALAWAVPAVPGGMLLTAASGAGLAGLVLFEFSRLLSFERRARAELSPQRLRPSPAIDGHSGLDRRRHER